MALDPSYIGRSYPPGEPYEVSRAKIREFADAIGDQNPVYRDPAAARAAGYPDVIAPPTFVTIVNIKAINVVAADPDLGLDYERMVHGDQTFEYLRPMRAGDTIGATVFIESIMARAGNDFITLRAEVGTEQELIVVGRAQLVIRG